VYAVSLAFTFVGAAIFSTIRVRHARIPQEAIIGICYAVASAAAILAMSKATSESEHLKDMLVGNILAVSWAEVGKTAALYGVKPESIFLAIGSDESLAFAFQAFCDDTRHAAFPDITYGFYPVYCGLYDIPYVKIPLREDFSIKSEDYYGINKNIIIANPNAPTGLTIPLCDIEMMLRTNPDHVVLIDEAYVDFGGETAIPLVEKYENLVVVQTFSKSRSLAGARLGFAVAQPPLIADLNRIKCSFNPYNVGTPAQLLGAAAMRDREYFETTRKAIMKTREWTRAALEAQGFMVFPSSANFLFARPPEISGEAMQKALRERGILVRRFEPPPIRDFLRVSIGTPEDMQTLVEATKGVLEGEK
jgi:histidinol-phosphate aminotransferase